MTNINTVEAISPKPDKGEPNGYSPSPELQNFQQAIPGMLHAEQERTDLINNLLHRVIRLENIVTSHGISLTGTDSI